MKMTVLIGPTETRSFEIEGDDLPELRALAEQQVPSGWRFVSMTTI